ncbi:hypothetical protein KAX35_02185 [candidate division WOR-3 bacterium]|nr:hypothetical protein [candidate division WOR-3 bacterium]
MPVKITKVKGHRVSHGGKVSAKSTTKEKAEKQANLLRAVAHGWKPTGLKGSGIVTTEKAGSYSNAGSYGDVTGFMKGRE